MCCIALPRPVLTTTPSPHAGISEVGYKALSFSSLCCILDDLNTVSCVATCSLTACGNIRDANARHAGDHYRM